MLTLTMPYMHRLVILLSISLLVTPPSFANGQGKPDPLRAQLEEAIRISSLQSEGVSAFQAEATFVTTDYLGKPSSSGSLTVTQLKQDLRRITVDKTDTQVPSNAVQDQVAVDDYLRQMLIGLFLHPGPPPARVAASKYKERDVALGQTTLRCLTHDTLAEMNSGHFFEREVDCLASDKPMIRMIWLSDGMQVVFNNFVQFGGRTFAREVVLQEEDGQGRGKLRARLTVSKLTLAPTAAESSFETDPLTDFNRSGGPANPSTDGPKILRNVPPDYPPSAKREHRSGSVLLRVQVRRDGSVGSVGIISAPDESFAKAAAECVKKWKFWPRPEKVSQPQEWFTAGVTFQPFGP